MDNALMVFDNEKVSLIKRTVLNNEASNDELELLLHQAKRTGLDPLAKQIYGVFRYNSQAKRKIMTIQTSIDGFRLIAERSGKYAGQLGPFWCGPDGVWKDCWTGEGYPFAAKVGILRSDFSEPCWGVAKWDSYVQTQTYNKVTSVGMMWKKMSDVMLAKCAEALALRKACPQELSGLYTSDEMNQADNENLVQNQIEATVVQGVGKVSMPQLKRLQTIRNIEGWSGEDLKALCKTKYNIDSSKDLTTKQYDELINLVQKNTANDLIAPPKKKVEEHLEKADDEFEAHMKKEESKEIPNLAPKG